MDQSYSVVCHQDKLCHQDYCVVCHHYGAFVIKITV